MPLSLLQIVNQAQAEIGLPVSAKVIGNSDQLTAQFLALTLRCGELLRPRAPWTRLQKTWLIQPTPPVYVLGNTLAGSFGIGYLKLNTAIAASQPQGLTAIAVGWALVGSGIDSAAQVATTAVTDPYGNTQLTMTEAALATLAQIPITAVQTIYPFPADWDTQVADTGWDRGERWRLEGPLTPSEDEFYKSGLIMNAPWRKYRLVDGAMVFSPPLTGTAYGTVSIEYMSRYWILSGGTGVGVWKTDADTCLFPDDLMVMGLKALFKQAKGLDYQADAADWQRLIEVQIARDNPQRTLSMARRRYDVGVPMVQDGNFPGRSSLL